MIVTLKYMGKMVGVKTLSKYDSLLFPSILHRSGYDILQNNNLIITTVGLDHIQQSWFFLNHAPCILASMFVSLC